MSGLLELSSRERIETALVRAILGLPPGWVRRLAGPPVERDGRVLDPWVALTLRARNLSPRAGPDETTIEEARRELDVAGNQLALRPPPSLASVTAATIGGRPARIYVPHRAASPSPALVYFHGGGFVLGSLESHDGACRQMAAYLGCVVIAVDYRLAPEHPFPAAADDATAAFRDVVTRASSLGVDPERVAVGGDSAGGNLCTIVALDTKDDPVRPRAQLAIYPATDFTMSLPSHEALGKGFFLEGDTIRWYRKTYLAGEDPKHPRASPLFRDDVAGLPPAVVVTAGFDPLRDEGDAWAEKLRAAGNEVTHLSPAGMFHGFWNCSGAIPAARAAVEEALDALRAHLLQG